MHTSQYSSVTFYHDGDIDGCMYAVDEHKTRIITTRQILEGLVKAFPTNKTLILVGPDGNMYNRHTATEPSYDKLGPGPWDCLKMTVDREDIEALLVSYRLHKLTSLVELLECNVPPATLANKLDAVFELLEPLAKK